MRASRDTLHRNSFGKIRVDEVRRWEPAIKPCIKQLGKISFDEVR